MPPKRSEAHLVLCELDGPMGSIDPWTTPITLYTSYFACGESLELISPANTIQMRRMSARDSATIPCGFCGLMGLNKSLDHSHRTVQLVCCLCQVPGIYFTCEHHSNATHVCTGLGNNSLWISWFDGIKYMPGPLSLHCTPRIFSCAESLEFISHVNTI